MIVRRNTTISSGRIKSNIHSTRYRVKDNEDIQKKLNENNKRRIYTKKQIQRLTTKTGNNIARKGIHEIQDVGRHSIPYVDDDQDADQRQEPDRPLYVHGQPVGSSLRTAVHSGKEAVSRVQNSKNNPKNVQPPQNEGLKKQLQVKRFVAQYPGHYQTRQQQNQSFHVAERISPEREHFRVTNRDNDSTESTSKLISRQHSEQLQNQKLHLQHELQAKIITDKKSNNNNVTRQSSDMHWTDQKAYSQQPRISIVRNDLRRKKTDNHVVEASETGMQSVEKMKQYQKLTLQQRLIERRIRRQADQQRRQSLQRPADILGQVLKRQLAETTGRSALFAGGILVLVMMMFLCMVAGLAASPFGILFSGHVAEAGTMPLSQAIAMINTSLVEKLDGYQTDSQYSEVIVQGSPPDWISVVALFSVKVAGQETDDSMDVVTINSEKQRMLSEIFWDMLTWEQHEEIHTYEVDDEPIVEKTLVIKVGAKSMDDMTAQYYFTNKRKKTVKELLEQSNLLQELIGSVGILSTDVAEVKQYLPENISADRAEVVNVAASLVGKVNYFWGGKWPHKGWCSEWGTLKQVTAAGSPTTGTYRSYGLDCSGFVDWVFYNATNGAVILGQGGGVTAQHQQCVTISWDDALPGDLVFYADNSHIGIVAGRDASGNLKVIQCASGANNVIISGKGSFASIGRPLVYGE